MHFRRRILGALAALAASTLLTAGVAYADQVANKLDDVVDVDAENLALTLGDPDGQVKFALIAQDGDGDAGCNVDGKSESVTFALSSTNASVADLNTSTITFAGNNACGPGGITTVKVTPKSEGTTTITLSKGTDTTGVGGYDVTGATFTVTVAPAAPVNHSPVVAVTGVAQGMTYPLGSVPQAGCQVNDVEDGHPQVSPTFTAIVGPDAGNGLGLQTATCSYTDTGGLTNSRTATYTIVDGTPPGIAYTLTPPAPDGDHDWYRGDVTLDWTVTEKESTSTLTTTGCDDVTVTTDQDSTPYTCAPTSQGGSALPVTVSIKRDGTPPVVTAGDVSGTPGADGWYVSPVTVGFTAHDALSGLAGDDSVSVPVSAEGTTTVDSPAFTDLAGNASALGAVSTQVKVDTIAPTIAAQASTPSGPYDGTWTNETVTVHYVCDDTGSGIKTCPADEVISSDTPVDGTSVAGTAVDTAGNTASSEPVVVKVDKTAPSLTATVSPNPVLLHGTATATPVAADALSGLKAAACGTVATAAVGAQSVPCTATDNAGNVATADATYTVSFKKPVILQPVNPDGSSVFKLGSTVPIKFQALDANDKPSGPDAVVKSFKLTAKSTSTATAANEDVPNTTPDTSFRYDSTAGQWIFNLSTKSGFVSNTKYTYTVELNDGVTSFSFTFGVK